MKRKVERGLIEIVWAFYLEVAEKKGWYRDRDTATVACTTQSNQIAANLAPVVRRAVI